VSQVPLRFAVVGRGWRGDHYLRIAEHLPDWFECAGVVTRSEQAADELNNRWHVPTYRDVDDMLSHAAPDVVVTSVAPSANVAVVTHLAREGVPVLSETPPAPTVEGLRELWAAVGTNDYVQVAEQHPFLPHIAAVREVLRSELLGVATSAAVSWTHDYHAVAILRSVLAAEGGPVRVQAVSHQGQLMSGPDREGWTESVETSTRHMSALIDFGDVTGTYDFTDGQWFNPLRPRALTVRASKGAVVDGQVTRNVGGTDVARSPIERRNLGENGNLEGFDLDSITYEGTVVYRNPFRGARLSDEEIAIASCLEATGRWAAGEGPAPYPLADACQDQVIALAMHRSASEGTAVGVGPEAWSSSVAGPARGSVLDL
jgi:predicted dehydrogenase